MGNKMFSKCGMRCDLCLIYRPNVEKEDRRAEICNAWKKYGKDFNLYPLSRTFSPFNKWEKMTNFKSSEDNSV